MGYQLWTSPITGYRRKGTRLADLRVLLGDGITARAILEPLQSCPADAEAVQMARTLESRGFDVAGVQVTREAPVTGFVCRDRLLQGLVRDHVQPITADLLISDATPLASLMPVLAPRERAFVLVGPAVRGIVTTADLNKPAVRVYLFGLISLLEMHLGFWIKVAYPDESWMQRLPKHRLQNARRLQRSRQSRKQDTGLLDCLQFCDKRDLVLDHPDLRRRLGIDPADDPRAFFAQAEDLRNLLAHSQNDLVQGSSWEHLVALVQRIEGLVHKSDELVEEEARKSAGDYRDELWACA